jgi:hypothetical protein
MKEIKLGDFIVLRESGRRYCIVNQKMMGDRHFALALPVYEKEEDIANAEMVILESIILEDGNKGTREYPKEREDYQEINNILSENAKI